MFSLKQKVTANWHLVQNCNYKCKFCFARFADARERHLDPEKSSRVLRELANAGVYKVNFAGGEPTLHPNLHGLAEQTRVLGMKASLITNGSLLSKAFFRNGTAVCFSQIGISCDSVCDETNAAIGRGYGSHLKVLERALTRMADYVPDVQVKLNTVVMRPNKDDDFLPLLQRYTVNRWKIFKILKIQGENDDCYDELSVTDDEFQSFIARHRPGLVGTGTTMVPEDNGTMTQSYIMLDPDARVYQNTDGIYRKGDPVYQVGLEASIARAGGFDIQTYVERGGAYAV
jgi:radical S-adenosyl methionine domain-containing protein 2